MKKLHDWNLSYEQARGLQEKLAGRVKITSLRKRPELIAGLDCAFSKNGSRIFSAVVVLTFPELEVVEIKHSAGAVTFPYIPGLLSFREGPVCISAVAKLASEPDVYLVDGQGIAHPRRLGLAAHLGLFFDTPTIGCAKSRLTGTYEQPGKKKGNYTFLKDSRKDSSKTSPSPDSSFETIGAVVRTRDDVKPLFISVGNKCTLKDAVDVVLGCAVRYRLPEPTRQADKIVGQIKVKS